MSVLSRIGLGIYQIICFLYLLENLHQKDMIETTLLSDLKILEKLFFLEECHGL